MINSVVDDNEKYFSLKTLSFVVEAFMIGVTIIVVAVPEVIYREI